jgi:hypothetical protein
MYRALNRFEIASQSATNLNVSPAALSCSCMLPKLGAKILVAVVDSQLFPLIISLKPSLSLLDFLYEKKLPQKSNGYYEWVALSSDPCLDG